MNYRQAEASYLEPQWDDEDVPQITSSTPEQTAAIYREARELLGIDEPPAPEPTRQVGQLIRDLADIDRLFKR
jgi:Ni,Fe-hydrogenase III component G